MLEFDDQLEQLEQRDLRRTRRTVTSPQGRLLDCDGRQYLAFCSNDYLGLANHPDIVQAAHRALDQYGVGAAASALISGHMQSHQQLERQLAQFVGLPEALYFSCGYSAALGVIPALVGRGDAVFSDALNHASLIDGMRLSRAQVHVYPHGDLAALTQQLAECTAARKLVVSDAVFSMDGDFAPVPQLLSLCQAHDATLMLDDAHGFGVLGEDGRGSLSHWRLNAPHLIYMATLGKAAGVSGAFVAASAQVIDWLVQRARAYVFSTSPPPMLAAAAQAALDLIARDEWRRQHLAQLVARLRELCADLPLRLLPSATAIQPLLVGGNNAALSLAAKLRQAGVWVPAIRPPTVPEGTARLRISLSAAHTLQDVERLASALRTART